MNYEAMAVSVSDLNMYIKAKTTEKSMELAREYMMDAKSL